MREFADLLVDLPSSMKIGWALWFSAGLTLAAWYRFQQMHPVPVPVRPPIAPVVEATVVSKAPVEPSEMPAASQAMAVEVPQEDLDKRHRAKKKLRRSV